MNKKYNIKNFYRIMVMVAAIALLNAGRVYVQASKEAPAPDFQYYAANLPSCGYGYGECRASCLSGDPEGKDFSQFVEQQEFCLQQCSFLYQDCKN